MSFLAPLFLVGAAAVALPVILHLIRRSSRERLPFSSLMFLLPTPPRVTRRSRLENVLLLLLRCAVICLLAFAFARPFLSRPVTADPAANAGQKILVLLDTSASMRRGGLWNEAKDKARAVFNSASASDQVACFTFDLALRPLMDFEQWSLIPQGERAGVLSKRLDEASPGWGSTRLGNALIGACELFESNNKDDLGQRHIVVISDLQEGSRLDGLQGFEWPKRLDVRIEAVRADRTSNAGLQLAASPDGAELAAAVKDPAVRVRISNSSDSKREQFQVGWRSTNGQGFAGTTLDVYVPPGQQRVLPVPVPAGDPTPDRLALTGDDDEFDNTIFVVSPKAERTQILFLGSERETDSTQSLYYLRRAFQETRSLSAEVVARAPGTPLTSNELAGASLMVVNDALPAEQIQVARNFVENGRPVLISLSKLSTTPTLGALIGQPGLAADEVADPTTYAMLGQIDFEHPLFAPFADPRYSDFTKIHFWKHRRLALDDVPGARVLARFDNGDPALAEMPIGKGRVWVLTSGWQPEDSQLALSSKFVPLLYAMLEQGGALRDARSQHMIGDMVALPAVPASVTVRKPDASEIQAAGGEKFAATDQPGIYMIGSIQPPLAFAVNLAPEESRTAPLPVEVLERFGVPIESQATSSPSQVQHRKERLQAAQLENRQKLWRWLIVAALVVLVLETWLAGRLTRRPATVIAET